MRYFDIHRIKGPQAIAIKPDKKNGTIMVLAALIPARMTIRLAKINKALAVGDRVDIKYWFRWQNVTLPDLTRIR